MDSSEVYLELLGPGGAAVAGDVEADAYQGQIALYDWGWGAKLDEATPNAKKEDVQVKSKEFTLSKAVDAASTGMLAILHSGQVCSKAVITMAQRTEKSIMLRIVLKRVRLMSCKISIDSDDTEVVMDEDWVLSFEEIELMYKGAEQSQDVRGKVSNSALRSTSSFKMLVPPGTRMEAKPERQKEASGGKAKGGGGGFDPKDKDQYFKMFEEFMTKRDRRGK